MFSWLMNPWMLGLGGLAVAIPIIIHLLNRRRFKIVPWAAMDFLLAAEKKNRRRVRLENLILLALRCLAMLLIGLFLARPFLPNELVRAVQPHQKYERIFVIDDSLSTQVLSGDLPAIEMAKRSLSRLISEFSDSPTTEDWLTVLLTSDPEQPLLANEPVTRETIPALLSAVDQIESSDLRADYRKTLEEARRFLAGVPDNVSRVFYLFSDLRETDWQAEQGGSSTASANELLNEIAELAAECYLVDIGGEHDDNLAILNFRALDLQVANRVIRFAADVKNFGATALNDIRVVCQVGDSPPQYQSLPSLLPGQSREVVFPFLFPSAPKSALNPLAVVDSNPEPEGARFTNVRLTMELDRQSMTAEELAADQLIADSKAYCAARIYEGIQLLLVDGDPSPVSERSETHYLNSLSVLGTGLITESITATELETVSLSRYRVIFLCNLDEASADRIGSLKSWVADGGNLVLMPGNKVRASTFNNSFYEGGNGLSPIRLLEIAGDPTMSSWVNFEVDTLVHPAFQVVVESDRASLSQVDVFSWWTSEYEPDQVGKTFLVPLRLSDDRHSAAMVERSWGDGRVTVFTLPGDGDWSMWPSSPTFAPVMVDLIGYLVGAVGENSSIQVGGALSYPVDLSVFENRVVLKDPRQERMESVARPIENSSNGQQDDVLCRATFNKMLRRGFYELGLRSHSGSTQEVLFSANVSPAEGNLKRLAVEETGGDYFVEKIKRLTAAEVKDETVSGGNTEIWPQIIWLLLAALATEQFLGWWFGRKR